MTRSPTKPSADARPLALALVLLAVATVCRATEVELPVNIPYAVVRSNLAERVFTEADESVEVLSDDSRCNSLTLSAPKVEGMGGGRMRVLVAVAARGGTPLAERCVLPFEWKGHIELIEEARVADVPTAIAFRIVDSNILDKSGEKPSIPGVLWLWLKRYVHPRMEAFTFDLSPLLSGTHELLQGALRAMPAAQTSADSLALRDAAAAATALRATLAFTLPDLAAADRPPPAAAPLTAAEMVAWDANWQAWDAFATWAIKTLASEAQAELRAALLETLVESRYALRDALAEEDLLPDPVRRLFVDTWQRLAPLVAQSAAAVDGATALRYLAFINAADALQALDQAGAGVGLRIDQDTLRRLARTLLPTVGDDALRYELAPDPALRALFGFAPVLEPEIVVRRAALLDWLIAPALAATLDPALLERLGGWIPAADDLDEYLDAMEKIFDAVIGQEQLHAKIPRQFFTVYRDLVRATAWQETCWRQFIIRNGKIEPIRSSAGSVGLMQVNRHVWRGLYDVAQLERAIDYNARAGNEILVHYLLDYAIKHKEHQLSGGADNLARAAYAIYNGGPSHLRRYRTADTRGSLRRIDDAFWRKYRTLREAGKGAIKQCWSS